jgi:hypothetical protein
MWSYRARLYGGLFYTHYLVFLQYMRDIIFIITILGLSFLLYKQCNKAPIIIDGEPYEVVKVIRDTDYIPVNIYIPSDTVLVDTIIYVDVPYLDSAKMDSVLKDYYAMVVSKGTLEMKPFGNVYVIDTIQKNRIVNRSLMADLIFPVYRDTVYMRQMEFNSLYLGPKIDYMGDKFFVGPSIMYNVKNKIFYGGFGVGNGKPMYSLGLNFKL